MLCVNQYPKAFIDECRSKIELQLSTYGNLVSIAKSPGGRNNEPMNSAVESFERIFFNNLVVLLDAFFVHRTRSIEKKDGNPLNEVRVMCQSILYHKNILTADNTIRLDPAKSVLKLHPGDEINLTEAQFELLFSAFFDELEKKYL